MNVYITKALKNFHSSVQQAEWRHRFATWDYTNINKHTTLKRSDFEGALKCLTIS